MKYCYISILIILLVACKDHRISIENPMAGKLKATHFLKEGTQKDYLLDKETAPKPIYTQLLRDSSDRRILSFLNPYNRSIYFYDYADSTFLDKISYPAEGADIIERPAGYYIKSKDSIFIYNMPRVEIVLTDDQSNIRLRIKLRDDSPEWPAHYPQYYLSTVTPFFQLNNSLVLTGQSFFAFPDASIDQFPFSAYLDLDTLQARFRHTYPKELYGSGSNWEGGLFTHVYPALSPDNQFIYSFPASHDLYICDPKSGAYHTVYGGSNIAKTIQSIDFKNHRETSNTLIAEHMLREDMYTAILHDPYRNVYYRYLLQGIPNATFNTPRDKKPVIIIMMDEEFNYLGETLIGTGENWNWTNSFVTEEGLNIEYVEKDASEDYLTFKLFTLEKL